MSTKLSTLRSALDSLRRRRTAVRLTTAFSGFLAAVIWILFGCFLLDWAFSMEIAQRLVLVLIGAYIMVRAFRRYAGPLLGHRETLLETAILVERAKDIDSDLVAALEFETPEAEGWGSGELQEKVKDSVAEMSKNLDVSDVFSSGAMSKRVAAFVVSAALIGYLAFSNPGFAGAFLDRMLLGKSHYPTDTTIEQIIVIRTLEAKDPATGEIISREVPTDVRESSVNAKGPAGEPLDFRVKCSQKEGTGGLPENVKLVMRGTGAVDMVLRPEEDDEGKPTGSGWYQGRLVQLLGDLEFKAEAGDAYTNWFAIDLIERPVVEVELASTAPAYAGEHAADAVNEDCVLLTDINTSCEPGTLQIEVQEGGRVDVALTCRKKKLREAIITISGKEYPLAVSGAKSPEGVDVWRLEVAETPFRVVQKRLKYSIEVTDEDGLHPGDDLAGLIQVRSDKPPRVQASMVSRYVLPSARPMIDLEARDDYGIGKVQVHVEVSRQQQEPKREESLDVPAKADKAPEKRKFKGSYACALEKYGLKKGDIVRLIVEVTDDRGEELEGESSRSEALSMRVTDRAGLLNAINELDKNSVRQLDAIIEKELGIGDSK